MTNLEIISVNLWNIIFAVSNLLLMFLVIKKFLFARVRKAIEERKNSIEKDYSDAAEFKKNAEKLESTMKEKLDAADDEAQRIIKSGEERADRSYDKIVAEAKDRASRIIENAEKQAEAEKEKAKAEIKGEIAEFSVEIARKLLEKEMTAEEHSRLIVAALSEMEEDGGTDK